MTIDLESRPMPERFQHLLALISSERFLKRQSLNNEIPFFICPFKPEEAVDMAMDILRSRDIWKQIHEVESTVSKDQIKELLQGVLDSENHLIPEIGARMSRAEFDVLFITGVGEVFPYIRSHNVLNNLQSTANETPTVMFFPGAYTYSLEQGASLDLFGRLHDDKYYRAFNIFHCEI
jgi:hypothetical protein